MTREDLFEAIGNLDDKTVEGNIVSFPKRRNQTVRWIGLAASVVILATAVVLLPRAFRGAGAANQFGGSSKTAATEAGSALNGNGDVVMEGDDGLSALTGIYWETESQTATEAVTEEAFSDSMAPSDGEYAERVQSQELLEENGLYGFEVLYNYFGLDDSLESVEVNWKDADGAAHAAFYASSQDEIREFMKYLGASEMELAKSDAEEPAYTVTLQLNDGGKITLGLFGEGIVRIMDDTIYSEDEAFWRGRILIMDEEAYDRFIENVVK